MMKMWRSCRCVGTEYVTVVNFSISRLRWSPSAAQGWKGADSRTQ